MRKLIEIRITGEIINKCYVSKSSIHGKGVFASNLIQPRRKIGSLSGLLVSQKIIPKKFSNHASIAIVELDNGKVLDSREFKNELCYINHSCKPNSFMRIYGYLVEIYALKKILPGEELTVDYGETHHEGKLPCKCGIENCGNKL